MKNGIHIGIRYRVLLIFLLANILVVASMFIATRLSFEWGIVRYVFSSEKERLASLADIFEEHYAVNGNWDFLFQRDTHWESLSLSTRPGSGPHRMRGRGMDRGRHHGHGAGEETLSSRQAQEFRSFEKRIILRDLSGKALLGPDLREKRFHAIPLHVGGVRIGELSLMPPRHIVDQGMHRFAQDQRRTLLFVAIGIAALAALLAFPVTGRFVRRITGLAKATNRLASGRYDIRVPEDSTDELGRLAADFNRLAETLEQNEALRRRWVADISHELRTPLSVLRGELESVQDGVRSMSLEFVERMHTEVLHLTRLVNDLYELSMADIGALTYHRENLDFRELLSLVLHSHGKSFGAKNLSIEENIGEKPVFIFGDAARLRQLLNNLLQNSLRYTDAGGRLLVRLEDTGKEVLLNLSDSAPGVPEEALPRLFDRLYRVDTSRNRAHGGAGLGLSLCRSIVEAHGGSMEAWHSPLGGLEIRIVFERK